jgi:CheY-like chemotaxis protein
VWCGAAHRSSAQRHGVAQPSASGARRVLVVDDEHAIRIVCRVNLVAAGIEVLEAADGETGIELARRERPDLILLDVMMPELDGWDVARTLAADPATRDIPIVFLTARAEMTDRRQAQHLGGVGYIVKPFDPVDLGDVVEGVLARIERGERDELRSAITHPFEESA